MLSSPMRTPENVQTPPITKITRGHSCILCQQRKVKCDRQKPCSNCIKARADCIPSVPTIPRRRRRKFSEQDLATRVRRYEQLLKKHGVKIEDDDDASEEHHDQSTPPHSLQSNDRLLSLDAPRHIKEDKGILFVDKGNSRYVEKYVNKSRDSSHHH